MVIADLTYEKLQACYGKATKNVNQMKKIMRYMGIDVSIDYSYKIDVADLDFTFEMFNKDILIDYSTKISSVRPELFVHFCR